MKKKSDKTEKKTSGILSDTQAADILNQIIADSSTQKGSAAGFDSLHHTFLQKDLFKKAVALCCIVLMLLFFLPGTLAPVPVSRVSNSPIQNAASAVIDFHISSLVPMKHISASLNKKPVDVTQKSYTGYSVEVRENGYLILEAETITGMTSYENILVSGLDTEAPHITSHKKTGDAITIFLTDKNGAGVDYNNIRAYYPNTLIPIQPLSFSEEKGCVVFAYPEEPIYIEIPDKAGNKLTSILEPVNAD